jgi:hypothetical protein
MILETSEIFDLIEREKYITVEISRPIIPPLNESCARIDELVMDDRVIDLVDHSDLGHELKNINQIRDSMYRKEIMNGIHRKTNLKTGEMMHYEERCYMIADLDTVAWIITIRNRCSPDLIPMVVDYDQDFKINESIYANGMREVRYTKYCDSIEPQSRYDIFQEIDTGIVRNGSLDDILYESLKIVTTLDRLCHSIFK